MEVSRLLNPSSTHELQHATNIVLQDSARIYKRIAARIPMSSIYTKGVPRCDKMLKDTCSHEHRYPPRFALWLIVTYCDYLHWMIFQESRHWPGPSSNFSWKTLANLCPGCGCGSCLLMLSQMLICESVFLRLWCRILAQSFDQTWSGWIYLCNALTRSASHGRWRECGCCHQSDGLAPQRTSALEGCTIPHPLGPFNEYMCGVHDNPPAGPVSGRRGPTCETGWTAWIQDPKTNHFVGLPWLF